MKKAVIKFPAQKPSWYGVLQKNSRLDPGDVAELLGIPKSTVLTWNHLGKLPKPDFYAKRPAPFRQVPQWLPSTIERFAMEYVNE